MVNEVSSKAALMTQPATVATAKAERTETTQSIKTAETNQDDSALTKEAKPLSLVDKNEQVAETADRLNQIAQSIDRNLRFSVDDRTGDVVIAVIDRETEEVIRQIPEDRVLAMRENIESLKGILFSAKI